MERPHFTLTVAVSQDGFISPTTDTPPQEWASAEEQVLFFSDVNAADWCIMGRHTHEAADRPDRHRIVFSVTQQGWQRPTQLWLDPAEVDVGDLAALVQAKRPLREGLILGGTRVHDWFLAKAAIDAVHLTVEPVRFTKGLTVFTGQDDEDPLSIFETRGFRVMTEKTLNAQGTRFYTLVPKRSENS
ncbi:MAG: hypothetical protein AAF222_15980 [Pseudomonadota bacterium]